MSRVLLAIAGHGRSGTTLLREICNAHPQITLTHELGCFVPEALRAGNGSRLVSGPSSDAHSASKPTE